MARDVQRIYRLEGTLAVEGEVTVGSGRDGADADIQVMRDGLGRPIIPGESLAGALVRLPGVHRWDVLDSASPIWIEDAVADATSRPDLRDHGNRDRRTGAAADKGVFSREVVSHGTAFTFCIDIEDASQPAAAGSGGAVGTSSTAARTASVIADALAAGIDVGARQSAGSGRLVWRKPAIVTREVGTAAGLLAALLAGSEEVSDGLSAKLARPRGVSVAEFRKAHGISAAAPQTETLTITIPFTALSPLLTSVAVEGVARMQPALELREGGWHGRVQLRQGLRVLSERIERTLRGGASAEVGGESGHSTQFEADLLDPRCALTQVIFGSQGGRTTGAAAAWRQAPVRTAEPVADRAQWAGVQEKQGTMVPQGDDANRKQQKLTADLRIALKPTKMRLQEHLEIEPWSGAPLPNHLYGVIAIEPHVRWETSVVTVDLGRLADVHTASVTGTKVTWNTTRSDEQLRAALALILLVLREASDGLVGVGHGTSRSLGEIKIDPAEVMFETSSTGAAGPLHGKSLSDVLNDDEVLEPFQEAWDRHLEQHSDGGAA